MATALQGVAQAWQAALDDAAYNTAICLETLLAWKLQLAVLASIRQGFAAARALAQRLDANDQGPLRSTVDQVCELLVDLSVQLELLAKDNPLPAETSE